MTPDAAIERLTGLVSYIRVAVRDPHEPAGADWVAGSNLVRDEAFLHDTMRSTTDARGIERDDIGMSLLVQGYAFRIASVAIGAWLVSGGVLDVSPENLSIQFGRNRPNAVLLERATWVSPPTGDPDDTLPSLHTHLVDAHLATIIDTSRERCRVGSALMWSNVATSCASSFGALMDPLADEWSMIRSRLEQFFASARSELAAGGEIVPIGPKWAWQRNACCLYYQDPTGSKCGDCSLHTPAERAARYAALRVEVES